MPIINKIFSRWIFDFLISTALPPFYQTFPPPATVFELWCLHISHFKHLICRGGENRDVRIKIKEVFPIDLSYDFSQKKEKQSYCIGCSQYIHCYVINFILIKSSSVAIIWIVNISNITSIVQCEYDICMFWP